MLAPLKIKRGNLAPGMVRTPFSQSAIVDPKPLEEQALSVPFKQADEPSGIAHLAVFLASSDAGYVTGSTYSMNGALARNLGQRA